MKFLLFFLLLSPLAAQLFTPPKITPTRPEDPKTYVERLVVISEVAPVLPTGSMKPVFDENYYLLIDTSYRFEDLEIGMTITFWVNEVKDGETVRKRIVHPIIGRSSDGTLLITKGVANSKADQAYIPYVTKENYDGLVVGWIRRGL